MNIIKNVISKLIFKYYVFKYNLFKLNVGEFKFISDKMLVKKIVNEKKSISRFGDGELKWAFHIDNKGYQNNDIRLEKLLLEILNNKNNETIICLPKTIVDMSDYKKESCDYWKYFIARYHKIFKKLDCKYVYGNSLITRPYMDYNKDNYNIFEERFNLIKEIWNKKDIIIIEGEKSRLGVGNDLFNNCKSIKRILAPSTNAFECYDKIYKYIKTLSKEKLYLFALGPTATVLAYTLSKDGYQCIDIGHIDVEYMWYKNKAKKKTKLPGKWVNEAGGYLDIKEEILESYKKEIIKKIEANPPIDNKKKVALYTLIGNYNYGNKLQHYASQHFIEKYISNVETIDIQNKKNISIKPIIKRIIKTNNYKRELSFKKFDKLINYKKSRIIKNKKCNLNIYDYYIVGSDQVWNTLFNSFSKDFLLEKIENNNKISLSSSFGVSEISNEYKYVFKENLKKFKSISVREDRGKEIVEELTGRKDVEVLVDPTMLLTPEEWDKVSNRPKQLDKIKQEKYILNYFLGNLSDSRKKEIEKIAKKYDCHIINILDKKDPFYTCGPSEFLYLEKHAFLICTDSFHSSVFAILYNRPFVIFDREQKEMENMNSRIDTLIDKFKLKNRRYNGKNITEDNLNHDYTEAYKILEKERKKSDEFLKKALDIK